MTPPLMLNGVMLTQPFQWSRTLLGWPRAQMWGVRTHWPGIRTQCLRRRKLLPATETALHASTPSVSQPHSRRTEPPS